MSAETYRRKFRTCKKMSGDSHREWATRLRLLLDRWLEGEKVNTLEDLKNVIVTEQFIEMASRELQVWLREKSYKSVIEMADDADMYAQAHWKKWDDSKSRSLFQKKHISSQNEAGSVSSNNGKKDSRKFPGIAKVKCYNCDSYGHYSNSCPKPKRNKSGGKSDNKPAQFANEVNDGLEKYKFTGKLNGKSVTMLRDTGASKIYVHPDFVSKADYTGKVSIASLANSTKQEAPLALVHLNVDGETFENVKVAVMNTPFPVLLGNQFENIGGAALVVTRSRAKEIQKEEDRAKSEQDITKVVPSPIDDSKTISNDRKSSVTQHVENNDDEIKKVDSDSHVEQGNRKDQNVDELEITEPRPDIDLDKNETNYEDLHNPFDLEPGQIEQMQVKDLSLAKQWEKAKDHDQEEYFSKEGILYRNWKSPVDPDQEVKQVVVPHVLRHSVLQLAHSIPLAGHLGIAKTLDRVLQHYFWPGVFSDVRRYCKVCPDCQKCAKRRASETAKLVKTPLIGEPFSRIGMDIVGPLPLSFNRNRFVLVIVDHATRFPEAIPLRNIEASTIADEMIKFFSRVGIPREILTDQGTNFTSALFTQLCRKLNIDKLQSSPYRPETNAIVERFNGTKMKTPLIGEPFSRIGMDIVGPLPLSFNRNRFVLVIVDHATRFPEAIPLRNIEASTIADEMIKFFSRVGIPREILTDQGTNFTSALFTQLCRKLNIDKLQSSPYRPETNAIVERFNGTLKSMLKKLVDEGAKDWDEYIPYVLFAYREVPSETTGFSPFELVYGWPVRGPLGLLKEIWTGNEESEQNLIQYIIDIEEKLSWVTELAHQKKTEMQTKQKTWYDKRARDRKFNPGDEVLVLLPSSGSKFLSRWQGPYKVIRKISDVNYEVDTGKTRKRKRIYHINLLRTWESDSDFVLGVIGSETNQNATGVSHDIEMEIPELWPVSQPSQTWKDCSISSELSHDQKSQLYDVLSQHDSVMSDKPGLTNVCEFSIQTTTNEPIRQRPYPLPQTAKIKLKSELDDMKQLGVISESTSPYAAPIVMVPKKDNSIRLCCDYRKLNAHTVFDPYMMPRTDHIIDDIGHAKYVTTIDLTKGYWQVPLDEDARIKSAFVTPFGHFQFNTLPFGLKNSGPAFQRLVDKVLKGLQFATAYIDDIVIHSDSWENHMAHIKQVLKRLQDARLTAKPKKCKFGMSRTEYLGFVIGQCKVSPIQGKIQGIQSCVRPTTKTGVRSFMGMANYYRGFIPNFAQITAPLSDLLRKNMPNTIVWNEDCENSFCELKKALSKEPVLHLPDYSKTFFVQTDASDKAIAGILSQRTDNGKEYPIAYRSRKLSIREQYWPTVEKECLAIVWAISQFEYYICGRKFVVETDHKPLSWLNQVRNRNKRLMKWSIFLQELDIDFVHRKGKDHTNVDALSRSLD